MRQASNATLAPQRQQDVRADRHLVMLGHLGTEARFATFLLDHAARMGLSEPRQLLALPMSRDDIADYLAINHDTLSRIFMRFEKLDVIERVKRHAVRILDVDYLTRSTPLPPLHGRWGCARERTGAGVFQTPTGIEEIAVTGLMPSTSP